MNEQLHKRTLKFIYSMLLSSNELIAKIGQLASYSAKSPTGSNIAYFRHRYGIYLDQSLNANLASLQNHFKLNTMQMCNASIAD